jgi:predicted MFS family arabinose efflux permease
VLVLGVGSAQLLAWGTLYYAIAVVGQPMRRELGMSDPALFGVFAWSLVLSGLLAPWAGRLLDRIGGRIVLASSGAVGALGFVVLATASSRFGFCVSWTLIGLAMALGLYDTCFAALAHVAPLNYRKSVTGVTLIAGLASTVAWPVSHALLHAVAWRRTCLAYAGVQLVCMLIYLIVLPSSRLRPQPVLFGEPRIERTAHVRRVSKMLALAFAGTAFIAGAFSAHLIQTLTELQISSERAVWLASAVGVMQVSGRLIEGMFGQRHSALRLGIVSFGGLAASTGILLAITSVPWLVFPFVVFYGAANGLMTIAKAAIPVELLGFEGAGATLGAFSAPSLLTRAAAPFAFAVMANAAGVISTLAFMTLIGAVSFGAFVHLTRARLHDRA